MRGDGEVENLVGGITDEELCTTTVTQFELLTRIYHKGLVKEERVIRRLIKSLTLLPFEEESSEKAAEIMGALLRMGKPINVIDVLIAGIATANGVEELITRDKDFKTIEEVYGHPKINLLTY